jgi:hypothetical protein
VAELGVQVGAPNPNLTENRDSWHRAGGEGSRRAGRSKTSCRVGAKVSAGGRLRIQGGQDSDGRPVGRWPMPRIPYHRRPPSNRHSHHHRWGTAPTNPFQLKRPIPNLCIMLWCFCLSWLSCSQCTSVSSSEPFGVGPPDPVHHAPLPLDPHAYVH